jgi:hypothetical protein
MRGPESPSGPDSIRQLREQMKVSTHSAAMGAALASILHASPATADSADLAAIQEQIKQLQADYEARISALEQRLAEAEASAAQAQRDAKAAETATRSAETASNRFNPAISLTLQGSAANYSEDPDTWDLPGFQLGGHAGLKPEGPSATETELTASANVDNWFYAQATVGLHEDDGSTEVDIEEAYADTLSLPAGLGLRFGRFYPEVGYLNTRHTHAWDFADAPLTNQAFLGYQYNDDGLRFSWLAPTDLYLQFGMEALRGANFPASSEDDDWFGNAQNYFVRLGGDVGVSHSYQLGLSYLRTSPDGREGGHGHDHEHEEEHGESFAFTGDSDLTVADLIWKWAPNGNPERQSLILQGEYFYRDEDGRIDVAAEDGTALLPYDGTQQGYYVQGIYQFMPRWRVGVRYDRLWTDNDLRVGYNGTGEDDEELIEETGLVSDYDPSRWSVMLDYSHSEYSRLRLQYARDRSRDGVSDDQVFLQYILSLGAHGAHRF